MIRRIQRKRTKGWKAPKNTVYVGRPSRWGNPFKIDSYTPNRDEVLRAFQDRIREKRLSNPGWFKEYYIDPLLKADFISCWCDLHEECHADTWMHLVNMYHDGASYNDVGVVAIPT